MKLCENLALRCSGWLLEHIPRQTLTHKICWPKTILLHRWEAEICALAFAVPIPATLDDAINLAAELTLSEA